MQLVITKVKTNAFSRESAFDVKYVTLICALFYILIFGRSLSNLFFYAFAGFSLAVFFLSNSKHCVSFLFFLLPFSSILKPSVGSISFFTLLFFFVVFKYVVIYRKFDAKLLFFSMIFLAYSVLFSGLGQLTAIISIIAGILLIYYIREDRADINSIIVPLSFGIFLSSVLALLKEQLPIINAFVNDTMIKLGESNYELRFSGLQGNPNYYTLDIILVLAAIIVLISKKKTKPIHIVLMISLSILGFMSLSKSFLLTWLLLIILWFIVSAKQGLTGLSKFVFICIIGVVLIYYFAYDSINSYIFRLFGSGANSLDDVTTGRSTIWEKYVNILLNDLKILFFGNGINTISYDVGLGTHNTYLESIFYLGIIGTTIFGITVTLAMGKINLKKFGWVPILVLLIRMFAINILTYACS